MWFLSRGSMIPAANPRAGQATAVKAAFGIIIFPPAANCQNLVVVLLGHSHPTIHVQGCTGDITRLLTGEVKHRAGDIAGLANAPHRYAG